MKKILDDPIDIDETEDINPVEMTERQKGIRKVFDWFDTDRNAKRFYTEEMEEMYKIYKCDHWDLTGPDGLPLRTTEQKKARPNTVENISFSLIEGLVAEFSQDVDIIDYPVEKGDDEVAEKMTDLKEYIAYKNRIVIEREKFLRHFFLYGTGIWQTMWDPKWKGGKGPNRWRGDIRWKALHPQTLFPDARCLENLDDGNRCHKAFYKTQEYIKSKWGVEVMEDAISADMLVGDETTDEPLTEQGEGRVLLGETWYKGRPLFVDVPENDQQEGLHVVWWAGDGNPEYLSHANYVYFDPGEDTKFPFHLRQCYPRENSIWGFGEAFFLKSPQIVRNKTAELILESHMHEALGQTFYEENAVTPEQKKIIEKFGTLAGMWFPMKNPQAIKKEFGKGAVGSLQPECDRQQKVMESLVGRFDISQGRTPGSVTAFRALDLLAQRAQVRLRSKERAITSSYEDCGNYINLLIMDNYTEERVYRIVGKDDMSESLWINQHTGETVPYKYGSAAPGPEFMLTQNKFEGSKYDTFNANDYKKAYIFDTNESIPLEQFEQMQGSLEEDQRMIEGEHYETYCPQFDTICKVSTSMPTDRVFYMEMAKELFGGQMIDAETFWYVINNGKFPPYEDLIEKHREMEQMQAQQEQQEQPPQVPPGGGEGNPLANLREVIANNPELEAEILALPPEQQEIVIQELINRYAGQQ